MTKPETLEYLIIITIHILMFTYLLLRGHFYEYNRLLHLIYVFSLPALFDRLCGSHQTIAIAMAIVRITF